MLPIIVVIGSGLLLQVKKQFTWIQPKTISGDSITPELSFVDILKIAQSVPESGIDEWADVDRLDIRPGKGVIKIRAENRWEIQVDQKTGEVLQVEYRRSDLIESIHDGSFFHEHAKLWLFFPAAIILTILWLTGVYMFILPFYVRRRKKLKLMQAANPP